MLIATCRKCGRANQADDDMAGWTITCAQCGASVSVPGRGTKGAPASGGRPRIGFRISRLSIVLLIAGVAVAIGGWSRFAMSQKAKTAAQELTCEELSQHGYGDNAHVKMSEFQALTNYVVKYKEGNSGPWDTAWVPVASFDLCRECLGNDGKLDVDKVQGSPKLRVILRSENARSESELEAIAKADTIDGLVVNDLSPLTTEEMDLLRRSYPAMDLRHCWVLEEGRTVSNVRNTGLAMLAGGIAMVLVGLWLTFKPR